MSLNFRIWSGYYTEVDWESIVIHQMDSLKKHFMDRNNMQRFNQIRDELDIKHIPYHYKVKNELGQWAGRGTF